MNHIRIPRAITERLDEARDGILNHELLFDKTQEDLYIKHNEQLIPIGGSCKQNYLEAGDNIEIYREGTGACHLDGENGSIEIIKASDGELIVEYHADELITRAQLLVKMKTKETLKADFELVDEDWFIYRAVIEDEDFKLYQKLSIGVYVVQGVNTTCVPQGVSTDPETWSETIYGMDVVRLMDDIDINTCTLSPEGNSVYNWKGTIQVGELHNRNAIFLFTKKTDIDDVENSGLLGGEVFIKFRLNDHLTRYGHYTITLSSTGSWSLKGAVASDADVRMVLAKWKDEFYYGLKMPKFSGSFTYEAEVEYIEKEPYLYEWDEEVTYEEPEEYLYEWMETVEYQEPEEYLYEWTETVEYEEEEKYIDEWDETIKKDESSRTLFIQRGAPVYGSTYTTNFAIGRSGNTTINMTDYGVVAGQSTYNHWYYITTKSLFDNFEWTSRDMDQDFWKQLYNNNYYIFFAMYRRSDQPSVRITKIVFTRTLNPTTNIIAEITPDNNPIEDVIQPNPDLVTLSQYQDIVNGTGNINTNTPESWRRVAEMSDFITEIIHHSEEKTRVVTKTREEPRSEMRTRMVTKTREEPRSEIRTRMVTKTRIEHKSETRYNDVVKTRIEDVTEEYNDNAQDVDIWFNGWRYIPNPPKGFVDADIQYTVLSDKSNDNDSFADTFWVTAPECKDKLEVVQDTGEDNAPYRFIVHGKISMSDLRAIAELCRDPEKQVYLDMSQAEVDDTAKEWTEKVFTGCVSLRGLAIPQGVTKITDCCFIWCTYLRELDLTASRSTLQNIGASGSWSTSIGFLTSTRVRNLIVPESVGQLENYIVGTSNIRNLIFLHRGSTPLLVNQWSFMIIDSNGDTTTSLPDNFHWFICKDWNDGYIKNTYTGTANGLQWQWDNTGGWFTRDFVKKLVVIDPAGDQEYWQNHADTYAWDEDFINKIRAEFGYTDPIEIKNNQLY